MSKGRMLVATLVPLLALTGCARDSGKEKQDLSQRTINVVVTTGMIADAVSSVGGDRVTVTALMGPGVDPHLYKASEGDVSRMSKADIIFYNGLHLEGAMTEVFEQMEKRMPTIAVSDGIEEAQFLSPPEFEGAHDPHVWFDVKLWMSVAEHVRDTFIEIDSTHAVVYRQNAGDYLAALAELDTYVTEQARRVPPGKRVLITAHDAFNYFGRAYGFQVRGLQGISTAAEAGTADMKDLAAFITGRKIPAIFVESSVPRRNIEAVQAAVKARGFRVNIGGELFSDAMGSAGSPEGTYVGMVRHNIDTIVEALLAE